MPVAQIEVIAASLERRRRWRLAESLTVQRTAHHADANGFREFLDYLKD